jgi:hypothetical protein
MKKLSLLFILLLSGNIFGQSQGPNSPISASYSAMGCLSCPGAEWSNWNNILTADGLTADVGLNAFPNCFQTTCYYSRFLLASNFGFNIPGSATIEGVKVEVIRMSSASPDIKDSIAQIITGGNAGNNHADSTAWTPAPVTIIYGDSADVWGLALIADSVNSINFGFRIMIRNGSASPAFTPSSIDNIKMTVYYSLPTGIFSQTKTANDFTISPNPATNELRIHPEYSGAECRIESVEIYDLLGQLQTSNLKPQTSMDISFLLPGIYFAVIDTGTEKITRKFIRSRD